MIVPTAEMEAYFSYLSESEYSANITPIHNSVEKFVKTYCRRQFESATYNEKYNGNGNSYVFLKEFPVTSLTGIYIGKESAIQIKNSSTLRSSVSISSTTMTLIVGSTTSTISFATYTTIQAVIDQINTLGNSWVAQQSTPAFVAYPSTDLITVFGVDTKEQFTDFYIPGDSITTLEVDEDTGGLYYDAGFPRGKNNVFVKYTAGYTADTMPNDLKSAVKYFVDYLYQRKNEDSFGLKEYRIGYNSVLGVFEDEKFPKDSKIIIDSYKKMKV